MTLTELIRRVESKSHGWRMTKYENQPYELFVDVLGMSARARGWTLQECFGSALAQIEHEEEDVTDAPAA